MKPIIIVIVAVVTSSAMLLVANQKRLPAGSLTVPSSDSADANDRRLIVEDSHNDSHSESNSETFNAGAFADKLQRIGTVTSDTNLVDLPIHDRIASLDAANSVDVQFANQWFHARQIAWDSHQLIAMLPSGQMQTLQWHEIQKLKPSQARFQPLQYLELKSQLQQEFGTAFRVDRSRDFLVVQPLSSRRQWANRMQQFLGNVQTYFSARQFSTSPSKFPMVAIVFPDRQTFDNYAAATGDAVPSNYVAYYSLMSNRVFLYESASTDTVDIGTIYHEAFHQIAFNTGIHYRSANPPRWIAEGMATAFETPGMYDHRRSSSRQDRLHPSYCRLAIDFLQQESAAKDVATLLSNDDAFQLNPTKAYSLSWALAFYFMEFQPQVFANYLQQTNRREAFTLYPSEDRLKDFQPLAPNGTTELSRRLLIFYQQKSNR